MRTSCRSVCQIWRLAWPQNANLDVLQLFAPKPVKCRRNNTLPLPITTHALLHFASVDFTWLSVLGKPSLPLRQSQFPEPHEQYPSDRQRHGSVDLGWFSRPRQATRPSSSVAVGAMPGDAIGNGGWWEPKNSRRPLVFTPGWLSRLD